MGPIGTWTLGLMGPIGPGPWALWALGTWTLGLMGPMGMGPGTLGLYGALWDAIGPDWALLDSMGPHRTPWAHGPPTLVLIDRRPPGGNPPAKRHLYFDNGWFTCMYL